MLLTANYFSLLLNNIFFKKNSFLQTLVHKGTLKCISVLNAGIILRKSLIRTPARFTAALIATKFVTPTTSVTKFKSGSM